MNYMVDTDREFFEKFSELQNEIRELSAPFQNPNTTMLADEVATWDSRHEHILEELSALLADAGDRIKVLKL